jgi:hypothetical protein
MSSVIKAVKVSAEEQLCLDLLRAEDEDEAVRLLDSYGYSLNNADAWHPLGENAGNFSTIGNQQEDGTAALVEKVVNSIDAVLLEACHTAGVAPESPAAPKTMQEAVDRFLGVKDGRLGALDRSEQRELAQHISVIATGSKTAPCYLVVDDGEGQTPNRFKDTFLSTTRSSPKARIPFVQGKFNAGGTGSLQFCGRHNIQLIISRRQPDAPTAKGDTSADLWGFTVIRRRRPGQGDRSSVFEYLAPGGQILRFAASSIPALPGKPAQKKAPTPYDEPLSYGTCVKLYNYRWRGRGLATLEARRELEEYLQIPCLPFRVTEARTGYSANYYATTVVGVWNSLSEVNEETGSKNVEAGFPAPGTLNVKDIGVLPYHAVVWNERLDSSHLTAGVFFLVNGQVHGSLPSDFVSRTLGFDYIKDHVLVAVDCTSMDRGVAEDLFMASRDRLRKNENYSAIRAALTSELKDHPGLRSVNAEWRERRRAKAAESKDEVQELINQLIKKDPAFAALFGLGGTIISPAGPGAFQKFEGKKFPTFFRIEKEPKDGQMKRCPLNKTVRVDFETDAENVYFSRANDPGELSVEPTFDVVEASHLWNGKFSVDFRVPWNAKIGDRFPIKVVVTDVTRTAPFVCQLTLVAREEVEDKKQPGGRPNPPKDPHSPLPKNGTSALQPPNPIPVRKPDWAKYGFKHEYEAIKIKRSENGLDFYVNIDHASLVTEMSNQKQNPTLVKFWFTWGLTFAGLAMVRDAEERSKNSRSKGRDQERENGDGADLESISTACDGLARVIVPIIRGLHDGPGALGTL